MSYEPTPFMLAVSEHHGTRRGSVLAPASWLLSWLCFLGAHARLRRLLPSPSVT
jgi:hypothetical protein